MPSGPGLISTPFVAYPTPKAECQRGPGARRPGQGRRQGSPARSCRGPPNPPTPGRRRPGPRRAGEPGGAAEGQPPPPVSPRAGAAAPSRPDDAISVEKHTRRRQTTVTREQRPPGVHVTRGATGEATTQTHRKRTDRKKQSRPGTTLNWPQEVRREEIYVSRRSGNQPLEALVLTSASLQLSATLIVNPSPWAVHALLFTGAALSSLPCWLTDWCLP